MPILGEERIHEGFDDIIGIPMGAVARAGTREVEPVVHLRPRSSAFGRKHKGHTTVEDIDGQNPLVGIRVHQARANQVTKQIVALVHALKACAGTIHAWRRHWLAWDYPRIGVMRVWEKPMLHTSPFSCVKGIRKPIMKASLFLSTLYESPMPRRIDWLHVLALWLTLGGLTVAIMQYNQSRDQHTLDALRRELGALQGNLTSCQVQRDRYYWESISLMRRYFEKNHVPVPTPMPE